MKKIAIAGLVIAVGWVGVAVSPWGKWRSVGFGTSTTLSITDIDHEPTAQEMAINRFRGKLAQIKQACYDGVDYTSDGDKINSAVDCLPEVWKMMESQMVEAEQAATPEGMAKAAEARAIAAEKEAADKEAARARIAEEHRKEEVEQQARIAWDKANLAEVAREVEELQHPTEQEARHKEQPRVDKADEEKRAARVQSDKAQLRAQQDAALAQSRSDNRQQRL